MTDRAAFDHHVAGELTAYKVARIGSDGLLHGVTTGSYAAIDRASCPRLTLHRSPHPTCRCGFHAFKDEAEARALAARARNAVVLEVALSGRFLEFERGYRAEYQRVAVLHLDNECVVCRRPVTGVGLPGRVPTTLADAARTAITGLGGRTSFLVPVCEQHAAVWGDLGALAELLNLRPEVIQLQHEVEGATSTERWRLVADAPVDGLGIADVIDQTVSTEALYTDAARSPHLADATRRLSRDDLHVVIYRACDVDPSGWRALLVRDLHDGRTAPTLPERWWREPVAPHRLIPSGRPPPPATWPAEGPR